MTSSHFTSTSFADFAVKQVSHLCSTVTDRHKTEMDTLEPADLWSQMFKVYLSVCSFHSRLFGSRSLQPYLVARIKSVQITFHQSLLNTAQSWLFSGSLQLLSSSHSIYRFGPFNLSVSPKRNFTAITVT